MQKLALTMFGAIALTFSAPGMAVAVPITSAMGANAAAAAKDELATPVYYRRGGGYRIAHGGYRHGGLYRGGYAHRGYYGGYRRYAGYGGYYRPYRSYAYSYPYYSSGYSYPYYSSSYGYPYYSSGYSYPYASYGYPYSAYAYRGFRRGYYRW